MTEEVCNQAKEIAALEWRGAFGSVLPALQWVAPAAPPHKAARRVPASGTWSTFEELHPTKRNGLSAARAEQLVRCFANTNLTCSFRACVEGSVESGAVPSQRF